MSGEASTPSIEDRLAAAGWPPLPRLAWLEIDLDALRGNLATIRELAGPGVPVQPIVKADAYGHGALPVARALEAAGADGFGVAAYDEAVALREGGITAPVLVLFPVPAGWAPDARRRRIALTLGDEETLAATVAAVAADDDAAAGPVLDLELEVETGLGRGGVTPDRVAGIARTVATAPGMQLTGLWTHFQAADDRANAASQLQRFEAAATALQAAGVELPRRHAAATAAILGDGLVAYDGVRPGLAIYGLVPDDGTTEVARPAGLMPVLSLHARPLRVAELPAGWGISYGPTFRTGRPSRIATLPVGYGDGWPRSLSNRAEALVRGRRVPLVGNVAMDAVMADVTDVPGSPVGLDDEFVLIGRQGDQAIEAAELAHLRTTNSWEVVTNLSARLPRVYDARSGPEGVRTLTSRGLG